jgi:phosphate:Na+ symporter
MYILADSVIIDWKETIFAIVGGLGIFLYGINLMGESLRSISGNKLKLIIEKSTNTPLKGIFLGVIITGLIQSSSGTTAITVGLVRAGLMTLPQAVGIILGANIGTTVTSFLIGLKIKEYSLPIMAVGAFLIFFAKNKKLKHIGGVLLGFGMLFFGLETMGSSLKQLTKLDSFANALQEVAHIPVLGLLVGALTTIIVQSSSATIGILQGLYSTGAIPLIGAIAIVLGDNIGTTVTAVLASLGGSVSAKRTAAAHVLFNLVGSTVFMILLVPYTKFIAYLETNVLHNNNPEMTISFAHMSFNIINTFIFFWFIKYLVKAVTKIIPGDDNITSVNMETLQEDLIEEAPVLALESAKRVVLNMGNAAHEMLKTAIQYSFENNHKYFEDGMQYEEMLDTIDKKAHDYLVKIAQADLSPVDASNQATYVDTIRDFERIGDHCVNLFEFFEERYENRNVFNTKTKAELENLYDFVNETLQLALEAFEKQDKNIAQMVLEREEIIDRLVIKNRKRHIMRISNDKDSEKHDYLYVDILSNVERIGDHCSNIAINVLQENYYNEELDFDFDKKLSEITENNK